MNNVHFNFNDISLISAIGPVPSKTCLKLNYHEEPSKCQDTFGAELLAVARRRSGLRVTSHVQPKHSHANTVPI